MRTISDKNIIGTRFNSLVVSSEKFRRNGRTCVEAECDCGNKIILDFYKLKTQQKSCGCYQDYRNTHGLSKHPLYKIWDGIKYRCNYESSISYSRYGQRGVKLCDEWLNNFESFYNWAIKNNWEKGLQVDRMDNNKNYSPDNCRIVTPKENSNNRRDNVYISFDSCVFSLREAFEFELVNRSKYYKNKTYRNRFNPIKQNITT